jgi:DnaJ-class molecular chaperone
LAYDEKPPLRRLKGLTMRPKIKEHTCPKCNGTGFPVVMKPMKPGRKIYPVKCKSCEGKGKITDIRRGDLASSQVRALDCRTCRIERYARRECPFPE